MPGDAPSASKGPGRTCAGSQQAVLTRLTGGGQWGKPSSQGVNSTAGTLGAAQEDTSLRDQALEGHTVTPRQTAGSTEVCHTDSGHQDREGVASQRPALEPVPGAGACRTLSSHTARMGPCCLHAGPWGSEEGLGCASSCVGWSTSRGLLLVQEAEVGGEAWAAPPDLPRRPLSSLLSRGASGKTGTPRGRAIGRTLSYTLDPQVTGHRDGMEGRRALGGKERHQGGRHNATTTPVATNQLWGRSLQAPT